MADEDVLSFLHRLLSSMTTPAVADRVVRAIQVELGGEQHYISTAPDERRAAALRMLRSGMRTDEVARALKVSPSTVYRWANSTRTRSRKRGPGLGRDGWNL